MSHGLGTELYIYILYIYILRVTFGHGSFAVLA